MYSEQRRQEQEQELEIRASGQDARRRKQRGLKPELKWSRLLRYVPTCSCDLGLRMTEVKQAESPTCWPLRLLFAGERIFKIYVGL